MLPAISGLRYAERQLSAQFFRPLAHVVDRQTLAQAGDVFGVAGLSELTGLGQGDGGPVLGAGEDDLVAHLGLVHVGDVDHHLVHADVADDGAALAVEKDEDGYPIAPASEDVDE